MSLKKALSAAVCVIAGFSYGSPIQFNMGDGTAYIGTEAPAGLTESVWNAPAGDVASGLLFADGSTAAGVTLDTGVDGNQDGTIDWDDMGQWRNSGSLSGGTGIYGTTLMEKYWYSRNNQNLGVRVSGLDAGEYDVYALVREHNNPGRTYDVGIGINSSSLSDLSVSAIADATGVTNWSQGLNFVRQRVSVSAATDFITVIVDNTDNAYAALQGLQIVPVPKITVSPGQNIQSAIDTVAASGGGTVSLSAGTYILPSSIQMKDNVTLEGVGIATRLELPADATYAMITDDGTEPCNNMTVRNMLLDGNIPESKVSHDPDYSDPQNGCLGIFFDAYDGTTYHKNVVIENVEIHNTVDACHLKGVDGGYIDNVYFHHNGIFFWPGHNCYLRRVHNFVVKNSRFEDSYNGSGINCSWSKNLEFHNCAVIRSGGRGIRNAASDGFVVHDCFIKDCGASGIIANSEGGEGVTNIDFRRNYITGCGVAGLSGGVSGVAYDNNSFGNESGNNFSLGGSIVQSGNISDSSASHPFDSNEPYGPEAVVPGQVIKAEEYDLGGEGIAYLDFTPGNSGGEYRTDDVDIVACSEGGYALSSLEDGEWLVYSVNIPAEGTYSFDVRYAALVDGTIRFAKTGLDITGDIVLPSTGGNWTTLRVLENITLEAGTHSIRIYVSSGYELNYFTINLEQLASAEGVNLQIEAESYIAQSGISVESCSDTNGGQNVSYINHNDWCQYDDVVLGAGGSIQFRVARTVGKPDSKIEVWLDSLTGTKIASVDVPETGGWQSWQTVEVDFPAVPGRHPLFLKFVVDGSSSTSLFNFNWFALNLNPVEYEAEDYSAQSGISSDDCPDVGGGENVANINNNDWCRYDNIFIASNAVFQARVARPFGQPDGVIEIRADDPSGTLLGNVAVAETGSWATYETVEAALNVDPGTYSVVLKFVESGTATGSYLFNLNRFSITPSSKVEPPETFVAEAVDDGQNDLSWGAMPDAAVYSVKRSTSSGGPYSAISDELTGTGCSDLEVLAGTNYFYVVTALYGSAESGNSIEVSVVPSNPISEGQYTVDLVGLVESESGNQAVSFIIQDAEPGHSFQLMTSDCLTNPDWQNVGEVVFGNGGNLNIEAIMDPAKTNLFYRLETWRQ